MNSPKRPKTFCRCRCKNCDCARWEKIFREKFEDPNYYGPRPVSLQSALSGLEPLPLTAEDEPEAPKDWRRRRLPSTDLTKAA